MNYLEEDFKKGYNGLIIIKDGKFNAGITFPQDATMAEWKLVKRGMNHYLKIHNELQKLQQLKPKDSHVRLFKSHTTKGGKC